MIRIKTKLDDFIEEVPLVGGTQKGIFYGRTPRSPELKDIEEIFQIKSKPIDFAKFPQYDVDSRFVLFNLDYTFINEFGEIDNNQNHKNIVRLGFSDELCNSSKSPANQSHLSIARCTAQEILELYNYKVRQENLGEDKLIGLQNLIFFGSGHGVDVWVDLLSKRAEFDGKNCCFNLRTVDGGFVKFSSDKFVCIYGKSRHLSPVSDELGNPQHEDWAEESHKRRFEITKCVFEKHFEKLGLDYKVFVGDSKK